MENIQRIKELRHMFLQLADILLSEMKEGKTLDDLRDITSVMNRINTELQKLETVTPQP